MQEITKKIVRYCKNNDFYNFRDNVNSIDEFKSNTRDLILFNPSDIIDYLKSSLDTTEEEKHEINSLINDINNISYEILINSFLDSIAFYDLNDINTVLKELLEKKLYKRFISLSLAYIIFKDLHVIDDILIKNGNFLESYIITRFNKMQVGNKSILSIMDQIDYKYSYKELTEITNKVRNDINSVIKGVK